MHVRTILLDSQTISFLPTFLSAIQDPFWERTCVYEADEGTSPAERRLLDDFRNDGGELDIAKITHLLKDPSNHTDIVTSLAYLHEYALDLHGIYEVLVSNREVADFYRFWTFLKDATGKMREEKPMDSLLG